MLELTKKGFSREYSYKWCKSIQQTLRKKIFPYWI